MNKPIGIIYSTVDGHTLKICEVLANHLREKNCCIDLYSIEQFNKQLSIFDSLVIGASVRYGHHNRLIEEFIVRNKIALARIKTAFFSVNLVARKEGKDSADNNPYLTKFLEKVNWQPDISEVFAGQLDYSRYSFLDKLMIKLIMKLTKGPTKTDGPIIFTNWKRVEQLAQKLTEVSSNELICDALQQQGSILKTNHQAE